MKLISLATTRQVGRTILVLKKNSPHLFFAGGLVGSLTSTFLACRATLKLDPLLDEIKGEMQEVRDRKENPHMTLAGREYTERDYIHDITYVYGKSAQKLIKLYGPSALLTVASVGALTGSHVQLTKRNSALTATVAALHRSLVNQQAQLAEEDATEEESKDVIKLPGKKGRWSPYARVFDDGCPNWKKDAELNYIFVKHQENFANHMLHSRGHVFLNDVYDALGLERSRAGAVVGWVLNTDEGDGYISFGLDDTVNALFVNHQERSAFLDFNVDGVVYDKI